MLNKKYDQMKTFLKQAKPLASIHDISNDLPLEVVTLGVQAASGSATTHATSSGQRQ
jgi:hypothetical protein